MLKENMETNFSKDKIAKYVSSFAAGIVFGVCIVEATTNHTKEICPIASALTRIESETLFNLGINHQISKMENSYEKEGNMACVNYNAEDNTFVSTIAPTGYILGFYDGETIAFNSTKEYISPIKVQDENGNITYMAPEGYALETREDGAIMCVKTVNQVVEPETLSLKLK